MFNLMIEPLNASACEVNAKYSTEAHDKWVKEFMSMKISFTIPAISQTTTSFNKKRSIIENNKQYS